MEQDHCPVVEAARELFHGGVGVRLVLIVPVGVGQAPEDGFVAQRPGPLQALPGVKALGRAVEFGYRLKYQKKTVW